MSMQVIEHIEVGSGGAATITFSAISQDFTDLLVVFSGRTSQADNIGYGQMYFNGSTANWTERTLQGNSSAASSSSDSTPIEAFVSGGNTTSNSFGVYSCYIPNYTSSNAKSVSVDLVTENNASGAFSAMQRITAGLWNSTSAITSITFDADGTQTYVQYSSATLYGIRKYDTTGSPKATGGIISYDSVNNKWVHTFTASGTFTPTENLTAEYLVIAGGGSGGGYGAGGGGAGGYRSSVSGESSGGGASAESPLSLTASTGYTVTVGAGGAGGTGGTNGDGLQSVGSNSVFATITSSGGGYGANQGSGGSASSGGSGGGGAPGTGNFTGGSGTANQGYDGGDVPSGDSSGAGGGGASAVGQDATSSYGAGGDGGNGIASSITGSSVYRAGGGGGFALSNTNDPGSGGLGGGGDGNILQFGVGTNLQSATAGAVNTGGGGGGGSAGALYESASGGSGIVIVRYAA